MKPSELRWLFLAAFVALLVMGSFGEPMMFCISYGWTNGRYSFEGGTAPLGLIFAVVIIIFYVLLMYSPPIAEGLPLPGVFRRFLAFWADFFLAMTTVGAILGTIPMITEWKRTGTFAWSFERTSEARGDWLVALITAGLIFAGLALYYALPLALRKPTPGACILGYLIVPEEGSKIRLRVAVQRSLLGFIAVCAAWLAPFVGRDRNKGQFWLDKVFHTRSVKFD